MWIVTHLEIFSGASSGTRLLEGRSLPIFSEITGNCVSDWCIRDVKKTCYSPIGLSLSSQYRHCHWQLCYVQLQGFLPSSGHHRHCSYVEHIPMCKQNTHITKISFQNRRLAFAWNFKSIKFLLYFEKSCPIFPHNKMLVLGCKYVLMDRGAVVQHVNPTSCPLISIFTQLDTHTNK